ncbi:MAG: hypothetical protein PPP58_06920 [Natronomonas sp.]
MEPRWQEQLEAIATDTSHGAAELSRRALLATERRAAAAETGADWETVARFVEELRETRPAMPVVRTRLDRVLSAADRTPEAVEKRAKAERRRAENVDASTATAATAHTGDPVLTLSRSGTVRRVLDAVRPSVYVAVSRPGGEGRAVAAELESEGFDVTLVEDTAVADTIDRHPIETVLVGADAVFADGSVHNKTGTRQAALAASSTQGRVDCYAVCASDKITAERFDPTESAPDNGDESGVPTHAPTFETTPGQLFDGVLTENGLQSESEIREIARRHESLGSWLAELPGDTDDSGGRR